MPGMPPVIVAALAFTAHAALAQVPYPSQPVVLIVPFAAGSGTDIGARVYAKGMSEALQTPVVVDNRPGANGAIGAAIAARAKPDGHTLLIGSATTNAANFSFFPGKLGYRPQSFEAVAGLGSSPVSMYVPATSPWKTLADVIAHGKAHPGRLRCGSGNSVTQVSCEVFRKQAGIDLIGVPYKSNPQSLQDLAGGHIDIAFADASVAKAFVDTRVIRPMAIAAASRCASMPGVATFRELGVPDLEVTAWTAAFVPAGTPAPIIDRLHAALRKATQSPEAAQLRAGNGSQALDFSQAQTRLFVDGEITRWERYVKASGIQPEQ